MQDRLNNLKIYQRFSRRVLENHFFANDGFGEKTTCNRLIVIDDVSGLADGSKKFARFLTVACKFNYTCVYIFHIIYPDKSIWRTILSQTNVFNIFPASVSLAHARRILESVCIRKPRKYIPQSKLWISKLFIELANRNDRVCLTLDCSDINKKGPGKFRTEANKLDFQTCYFNVTNNKQSCNEFVSQRINGSETDDRIQFKIIHLKSKINTEETFDSTEKLRDLNKNNGAETKAFVEYLTSDYAREILAKNKIKIHLDTGNIYRDNTNLGKSIYDFLLAQKNEAKKLLDYEINFTINFDSYINEIINPITDDGDDLHT